jgi:hypothetical protein
MKRNANRERNYVRLYRRSRRWQSGRTLIEALIAALLALFIGSALLVLMQSTITARGTVLDENTSMRDARATLDMLADNLRNAQMVGVLGVFSTATSNSITCYTNTAGTTTSRYWLDTTTTPYSFKQTVAGVTTVLLTDVQSVQFTYYVDPSATDYTSSTLFGTSTNPNAPTVAEIPNIGAIGITVTVSSVTGSSAGVQRTVTTMVRLRNSPAKTHI